jgi:hypothetical protein
MDDTIISSAGSKASAVSVEHWREAMAHLRHLSDDVWTGLKVFLTANAAIALILIAIGAYSESRLFTIVMLIVLSLLGAYLTLTARYILKRHRVYYLQMLAKKSLIEDELGFYQTKLDGTKMDLAFPWRVTPEVVAEIKHNPEAWVEKMIRPAGTIARWQFLLYEVLIGLYGATLLFSLIRLLG